MREEAEQEVGLVVTFSTGPYPPCGAPWADKIAGTEVNKPIDGRVPLPWKKEISHSQQLQQNRAYDGYK